MSETLNPIDVQPETVENYRQNRPTLVARDLAIFGVPSATAYAILMARGVFKWLAVRRDLIKLKNAWKVQVTLRLGHLRIAKAAGDHRRIAYLRGEIAAITQCRAEVRALCHSKRWRCPDCDPEARRWMESIDEASS